MSLNSFGCPISSEKEYRDGMEEERSDSTKLPGYDSSGLWFLASHFNHSCLPNASRSFIGNFMIIRAAQDLAMDEELTMGYVSSDISGDECQKKLSQWGFKCDCKLCRTNRTIPKKRISLLHDLQTIFSTSVQWRTSLTLPQSALDKANRILNALEETYVSPAETQPRLPLFAPLLGLARLYAKLNRPRDVITTAVKALLALGFDCSGPRVLRWGVLRDRVVETFLQLAQAYGAIGNNELRDQGLRCARISYAMLVGESVTFDEVHPGGVPFWMG